MYWSGREVVICLAVVFSLGSTQPVHHSLRHHHSHAEHLDVEQIPKGVSPQNRATTPGSAKTFFPDPEGRKERYELLGWASLFTLFIFASACAAFKLISLIIEYRSNLHGFQTKSFSEFLTYRLETWFITTYAASAKLIILIFFLTVLLGSLLCGSIMEHKNPFTSLWYVCSWVLDPGSAFGLEDHHILAYVLSALLGIIGILMLALLLTLMQDGFNNSMEKLKKGESPVIESGHIMIIGYTGQTPSLLQELCQAHKSTGGTSIVVLSDRHTKSEMDADIAAAEVQMMGTMIVTRCGKPHSRSDLRHVATHTARTIILLPKIEEDMECRDAFMLRTLITLRGQGWPFHGRIVAVCSQIRNLKLFQDVGGDNTDIVMVENFIAKIMTRCSRYPGLSSTFSQVFTAGGSDFLINSVPKHLDGVQFSKACEFYPDAVPVGVLQNGPADSCTGTDSCHLCPGVDFILEEGQEMIFIATNPAATQASAVPDSTFAGPAAVQGQVPKRTAGMDVVPETILMSGWNELAGNMILELDDQVASGTELIIIAEVSKEEREKVIDQMQVRWKKRIENLNISHTLGRIVSRFDLDDLGIALDKTSRIFFLADANGESSEHVDACTVAAILQVREMLLESGVSKDITIIPEIKDPLSATMCTHLGITDFIDTSGLPSKVLAMVASQPRIQLVLNEIISQTMRASFSVQSLGMYVAEENRPARFNFRQVASLVGACGDVAIGWSKPFCQTSRAQTLADFGESVEFHNTMAKNCKEAHGKNSMIEYELNPDEKSIEREWSWAEDKIVVLTRAGL